MGEGGGLDEGGEAEGGVVGAEGDGADGVGGGEVSLHVAGLGEGLVAGAAPVAATWQRETDAYMRRRGGR